MVQQNNAIKDVEIKGSLFPLSILQLEDVDLSALSAQLEKKLTHSKDFFYRAPLVINIEKTHGALFDFAQLKQILESHQFICVGVSNASAEQADAAKEAGLAILKQPRASTETGKSKALNSKEIPAPTNDVATPIKLAAKIVRQNVRSGQQVYAKDADLIVIGSVGNGAEVIADGNIHIYGQLRGRAIAGASGSEDAIIYCQKLEAELVSIAGSYWLSDQLPENIWQQCAIIHFNSEKLTAQPIGQNGPKSSTAP